MGRDEVILSNPPCHYFCGMKGVQPSDLLLIIRRMTSCAIKYRDIPLLWIARLDVKKAFDSVLKTPIVETIMKADLEAVLKLAWIKSLDF
eukprot:3373097-Karenia_brevis.AAC.1